MRILATIILMGLYSLNGFSATNAFQAGVEAFKQEDFAGALRHFQTAEAEGNQSSQLKFNLGSTYYKLRRYRQAERYFRPLANNSKWRDVALFNLGLIAEKLQNDELAQHYFLLAYQSTSKASIQELANRKINQINISWSDKKTLFSTSLLYGNDDNAIAFPDDLQANSGAVSDNFLELYLFGQQDVKIDNSSESSVQGFVYKKAYQDLNSLDVAVIGASLFREPTSHQYNQGLSIISSSVDDDIAYHQLQFFIGRGVNILNNHWQVAYEPSYFIGGDDFNQLDGWRHRFSGVGEWRWDANALQLGLKGEINSREDLGVGDSRYSYSPTRLGIATTWGWYYSSKLNFSSTFDLTSSRYSGKNTLEDLDGEVKNKQRRGTKIQVNVEATYLIDKHWSATANFEHVNNKENFELYSYERNQISIGVTYNYQ